ncbi:hypothetical protein HDU99_008413 [Rhizoclosmatium hyalinum]|nr:hypothetical protein HDU99_008413 [Rhizoclosmatium hyalinum]
MLQKEHKPFKITIAAVCLVLVSIFSFHQYDAFRNRSRFVQTVKDYIVKDYEPVKELVQVESEAGKKRIAAPSTSQISIMAKTGSLRMNEFPGDCPEPKRALIGMFVTTDPVSTNRRNLLRATYKAANAKLAHEDQIDFMFVFGNAKTWSHSYELALEEMSFPHDTVITEREENLESGKNLDWLKYARNIMYTEHPTWKGKYCLRYRFIGKTDDDTVIHVARLSGKLKSLPINKSNYVGRDPPLQHHVKYMTGLLYLLSPDVVEWINFSPIPLQHLTGYEDIQVGVWLNEGKIPVNFVSDVLIHDLEESPWSYNARSTPKSLVIHWCKDPQRLFRCISDLYGTPPSIMNRLVSQKSIELHANRLQDLFPQLKNYHLSNGIRLVKEHSPALQVDAALLKLVIGPLFPRYYISDSVSDAEWLQILTHLAARIPWLREEPLHIGIWRAIAAMNIRSTPSSWERQVATKITERANNSTLTWEEVDKIRSSMMPSLPKNI